MMTLVSGGQRAQVGVSQWAVCSFCRPPIHGHRSQDCLSVIIRMIIVITIIIIITRPKPAYGRQGLAGFWGQDTDQAGSFWGVLNVSLRAYGAQLGFKPTRKMKNHKKQPGITKHLHGTMNNQNNYLEPKITIKVPSVIMKNQPETLKDHKNRPGKIEN